MFLLKISWVVYFQYLVFSANLHDFGLSAFEVTPILSMVLLLGNKNTM